MCKHCFVSCEIANEIRCTMCPSSSLRQRLHFLLQLDQLRAEGQKRARKVGRVRNVQLLFRLNQLHFRLQLDQLCAEEVQKRARIN
jgi:hypothetical protein